MSLNRGRFGFRYQCAMPDCTNSVDVWSDEPNTTPSTYSPPDPWRTEYGGIWCQDHWPAVEAYRAAQKEWSTRQQVHHRPLYKQVNETCMKWEAANPPPSPPWIKRGRWFR